MGPGVEARQWAGSGEVEAEEVQEEQGTKQLQVHFRLRGFLTRHILQERLC